MKLRVLLVPLAFWSLALAVVRVAIAPGEGCDTLEAREARSAALAAGAWLIGGQRDDGSYVYEYDRDSDSFPEDYNIVRHAGVTMALYQVAGRLDDEQAMEAADRGTAWMLARMVEHDGWLALADDSGAKLGASALMTVALAERRLLTGDTRHDELLAGLGRFMVALQRPDGGFHIKFLLNVDRPETGTTSLYYPGEALWGLALLHEAFPDDGWDDAAWPAADFITLLRDEVEGVEFPPLNDHWAAYGLAEMVEWGLEDHHTAYARALAGRFSFLVRVESQKGANDAARAIRGPDRRAASLGTWVEGMAALWRLAAADERLADIEEDIRDRAACGAALLEERQADGSKTAQAGAWFVEGVTRMDDQQHAISGLIYTADALEGQARREPDAVGASR